MNVQRLTDPVCPTVSLNIRSQAWIAKSADSLWTDRPVAIDNLLQFALGLRGVER